MLELWARGFAEYFISTCVGEMPPSDTGTDNLAHLQKARQLRVCAYEHRLHCAVVWAASIKTILCLYSTSVFYWGLLAQYKSVVSNKILILLFQQSQFIYHYLAAGHANYPGLIVWCVSPTSVALP